MIRAIAFDLDDTLLRDDRTISPYTLRVLRRASARGIHILPASGRAKESMIGFVRAIGCASAFIACNGAEIYGSDEALWESRQLEPALAREVAAFAREEGCYAQSYAGGDFFYDQDGPYAEAYAASSLLRGVRVPSLTAHLTAPTPKVLMMDSDERIAQLLLKARARFGSRASVSCSKPCYLEINPLGATKGHALQAVAERLGFPLSACAAYGDGLNDLSMLKAAGLSVAVSNARPEVIAAARAVCGHNHGDGVARHIADAILKEEATDDTGHRL